MIKNFCDECGAEITDTNHKMVSVSVVETEKLGCQYDVIRDYNSKSKQVQIELCNDCYNKFLGPLIKETT